MAHKRDITIIGGGIVGTASALMLTQKGFDVTIIEPKGFGEGCSKGNAGHFATEAVFPLADKAMLAKLPKMLLDPTGPLRIDPLYLVKGLPWFVRFIANMRDKAQAKTITGLKQLNENALAAYVPLIKLAGLEDMIHKKGSLSVYEKAQQKEIIAERDRYHDHERNAVYLTGDEVRDMEPSLCASIKGALYFPDVWHTSNPQMLCKKIGEAAILQGAMLIEKSVDKIVRKPDGFDLLLERGEYHCTTEVVVAAGAWSKSLIKPLGHNVPLDTERGYHLMLPNTTSLSRPITAAERKFIMTPMQEGLRLAGTVEFAGLDKAPNYRRADILATHTQAILKGYSGIDVSQASKWMGFRPSLPDSLPVIGASKKHRGLYFAFGNQHLGLTQAAITAKMLLGEIIGDQKYNMEAYGVDRF